MSFFPDENLCDRRDLLVDWFRGCPFAVVAFSGGIDSSVLGKAAHIALGDKATAVFVESPTTRFGERKNAQRIAALIGIPLLVIQGNEFEDRCFTDNPPDRCYHCKRVRFSQLLELAKSRYHGAMLVEGSNFDDLSDYRPGKKAAEELNIRAPLAELGFTKQEIRRLAKMWNLPHWDRPSQSCLATRIDYGIKLDEELLRKINLAEEFLNSYGFSPCRVRFHCGNLVRIEVPPDQIARFAEESFRLSLTEYFSRLDFRFVSLDLAGFRSGSMNREMP